jgi:excisionase family DNA binding protein
MPAPIPPGDELLTPAGVAALLYVDPKTVTRWAMSGKLHAIRTPGGHRRYLRSDVLAILAGLHPAQQVEVNGAAARVADALAIALETEAADAAEQVLVTAAAAVEAADVAASAAARARGARATAAGAAAEAVAREAVRTARRVQIRADVAAAQVEQAAAEAMEDIVGSAQGTSQEATRAATSLAATVEAAARATSQDTAIAAGVVAEAVTAAAAHVARAVTASNEAFEEDVAATAQAVLVLTDATAARTASQVRSRAEGAALAAQRAVDRESDEVSAAPSEDVVRTTPLARVPEPRSR